MTAMRIDGGASTATAYFPRPDGHAATLRSAAAEQRRAGESCAQAADDLRTRTGTVRQVWTGEASAKALTSLNGYAALLDEVDSATSVAAGALDTYAGALETVQHTVDDLNVRMASVDRSYRSRLADAQRAGDLADQLGAQRDAQFTYANATGDLQREYADAKRSFDDDALACLRALESTLPSFVRGHNESLDDWVQGMMTDWATRVPVLRDHMSLVHAAAWASTTALPTVAIATLSRAGALKDFLQVERPLTSGGLLPRFLDQRLAQHFPQYASFLDGQAGALSRLVMGTDRTANVMAVAADEGLGAAARTSGLLRGAGIVGGVVSTGVSAANVIAQGNPADAFRENGAAYVADVAEVGFNASLTAAMIAPNPVTIGATVVTGVVYAGAEIVANWDDIVEAGGDAVDLARRGAHAAGDAVGAGLDAAADLAKDAASFLNPFD